LQDERIASEKELADYIDAQFKSLTRLLLEL